MGCTEFTGDLYIEITDDCNLLCAHCYNDSTPLKGKRYLSLEEFKIILDKAKDCSIKSIALSGGEPLLNPQVIDIVHLINQMDLSCRIVTNGTLIDRSFLKSVADYASIQISLDGSTSTTHELLTRVSGSFEATVSSIKLLNEMGIPFNIKTVISPYNYMDLDDLVKFAINNNAKGISFSLLQPFGRAIINQKSLQMSNVTITQLYIDKLLFLFNNYPGYVSGPKIQNTRCPLLCANESGNQHFSVSPRIDPHGNVYACAMFISKRFSIGNIFEKSFNDIFASDDFSCLIQYMALRERYVEECNSCSVSSVCGRGCPASSLEIDTINPNVYCKMVKWKIMSDALKGYVYEK